MTALANGLSLAAVVGAGVVSGILYIFSNTVMAALARQGADQGAAAMVAVNEIILNPVFLALFMGTAVVGLAAGVTAIISAHEARYLIVAAGAAYILGVFVVTAAVNVPLNDQLAAVTPGTDEARVLWEHYLDRWTRWNTIRSVLGMASTLLFALALLKTPAP